MYLKNILNCLAKILAILNKSPGTIQKKRRQLMAIMFTDIVGYTAMMQQDEKKGISIREKHRDIFSTLSNKHGGRILQYFGDGTLSIFKSSINAVLCGIEIQRAVRESPEIPLRIGIHTGEVIRTANDLLGLTVNKAARVASAATGGGIMVSSTTRDLVGQMEGVRIGEPKIVRLKGIADAHQIAPVEWQ